MKTVLFLVNHDVVIYNFRLELVERLLKDGHRVVISSPYGERIDDLVALGCEYEKIEMSRHGMNPVKELSLLRAYKKLLKRVRPDIVFAYTIKPNIYGAIACRAFGIPCVVNITGLGTAVENGGLVQKITVMLYRFALKKVQRVYFQNTENMQFFADRKLAVDRHVLLPGSGVNLERFAFAPYPENSDRPVLLVIGRLMKDKGTDELLYAAARVKEQYPGVTFRMIGFYDDREYEEKIQAAEAAGLVEYLGAQRDVRPFLRESHGTVHASYHEGMANVLLETAACGRPVIATDVPGCRETYDDGVSGFSCAARDGESLAQAILRFLALPHGEKARMGAAGRAKMEKEFDRQIVVEAYLGELAAATASCEEREEAALSR